jgi:hypothetical protein
LRTHLQFIPVLFLAVFYSITNVNANKLPDDSLITSRPVNKVPDDSIITALPVTRNKSELRFNQPSILQQPSTPKISSGIKQVSEVKVNNYKRFTGLKYSGYIRSYTQYRTMPIRYGDGSTGPRNLLTENGYDLYAGSSSGYNEPLFLLRVEGSPTAKTFFKLEYMFDNQMAGQLLEKTSAMGNGPGAATTKRANVYRIMQFEAKTSTKLGDFKIIAGGGVLWYRMSPFILWQYQYRDDMFERYPWEPEGSAWGNRYSRYYGDGTVPRDARWGNSGNQGFILEAKNLPGGFEFSSLFGKTDNSGGFQTYLSKNPRNAIAERLSKSFGAHKFSLGYFSQFGYLEAQAKYKVKQQIITMEGRLNYDAVKIFFEAGAGRFMDSIRVFDKNIYGEKVQPVITAGGINYNWWNGFNNKKLNHKDSINHVSNNPWKNRCINLTFDFQGALTGLHAQVYSISKSVVNVNSDMINSSNGHALSNSRNAANASGLATNDITTFPGLITEINQMTNNRQALNLKYENNQHKFKFVVATGMGQEIENLGEQDPRFNAITFFHRANAFTRSRFYYYNSQQGPYGRVTNIFRRSLETIAITDDFTDPNQKKYNKGYNTIDVSLKYKINFLQREMIFINYFNGNTVTDHFTPIPVFSKKAFVQTYYEEFTTFYALHPKLSIMSFFSIERNIGNSRTALADANGNLLTDPSITNPNPRQAISNEQAQKLGLPGNGKAMDQVGRGFGLGFDYDINGKTGFYVRHRWFSHRDKNFILDRFKGQETSVEFKVFF